MNAATVQQITHLASIAEAKAQEARYLRNVNSNPEKVAALEADIVLCAVLIEGYLAFR